MDCRECPYLVYHPGILGWHECGISGCQVCGEDWGSHTVCPLALPVNGTKNTTARQKVCLSVLRQVAQRNGSLDILLAHYSQTEQDMLRGLLLAV